MAGPGKRLEVVLGGQHAGCLIQDRHGQLSFLYDEAYRRRPDATPLSLSMPLSQASHPHRTVDAFLRGLLPDSEAVLQRWGRRYQVSANSPFALLAHVGEDVAGAAQFVTDDRLEQATTGGEVYPVDHGYIAERLRILRGDQAAWDDALAPGQFSLAGAQSKFALYQDPDGTWGLPTGRKATTHIVKPALPYLADQDVNEHLCLRAARKLGLRVAHSEIMQFGNERAIVLRRYDRAQSPDGEVLRIHQEDFCQALAVPPSRKYEREDGGPGVLQMAALMRRVQPHRDAERSAEHFAKALAFNWVIYGPDAHAKNYSILLHGAEVQPSPLYDVSSVLPYPDRYNIQTMAMAMSVNRKYQNNLITSGDWTALADGLGIDHDHLATWVYQIVANAPDAFVDAAADDDEWLAGVSMAPALIDGVANSSGKLLRFLDAPPDQDAH